MKQKAIFIIFKGLSFEQIKQFFLEGESLTLRLKFSKTIIHFNIHSLYLTATKLLKQKL